jgi:hypothetical protein
MSCLAQAPRTPACRAGNFGEKLKNLFGYIHAIEIGHLIVEHDQVRRRLEDLA